MIKFRLKELMARLEVEYGRKITFEMLSKYTGISRQTLARIASPKGCNTSTESMERLCRFFKCGPDQLLLFDPALPSPAKKEAQAPAEQKK
ncbi:MAG: helix-turn-helix transcriptional regulator [Nitrospinae bacterium]|nr:helix-turn-helix transcriptional regulator [Nitrospinota bacterium]